MQILDNFLIIVLHVLCFAAGVKLANWYNKNSRRELKEELQRQYLRLKTNMDADDPCRPYMMSVEQVAPVPDMQPKVYKHPANSKQPISPQFMEQLQQTGQAKTQFRKSEL